MRRRPVRGRPWAGAALVLLASAAPRAASDVSAELELQAIRARSDATAYGEALERAARLAARESEPRPQRAEAHRLAALAAFHLGELATADEHFRGLLRLDPDAVLDPFAAPPAAVRRFEQVRAESAELIREARARLAAELERAPHATSAAARGPVPAVAPAATAERAPPQGPAGGAPASSSSSGAAPSRSRSPASPWSVVLPFGLAQLEQGRPGRAAAFGGAQAALAATSVLAFWMHRAILTAVTYEWTDRVTRDGRFAVTAVGVPPGRAAEAAALRWVCNGAAAAFYLAWALGSLEALLSWSAPPSAPERPATGDPPRALGSPATLAVTPHGLAFSLAW